MKRNATTDTAREPFSPSIEALEAFVAAVEHPGLSLRKLAAYLGCSSHTQVKARLGSLEEGYGISFGSHEQGQDFLPTAEGEKLYRYARQVLGRHRRLRRWPPDETELLRLGVSPDVMRLLFAPLLKGFLAGVGERDIKVTLREREPSALSRLLGARRIDTALHGVLVDDRGAIQTGTWAPGLNARLLGTPYSLVAVARPEVFRRKTGELASLDALAAEVEPLCIQRVDYQDLERMGQLPRARRWILTDTQAGSVTLAEAGLGAGLIWDVPGLYEQFGLQARPIRNSLLPSTQLAVWTNAADEARRREAVARHKREWDPVLAFLDGLVELPG